MVNAIFCAHGKLACATVLIGSDALCNTQCVEAVELRTGENAGDIVSKAGEKLVSIHSQDEWLIAWIYSAAARGMRQRCWRCAILVCG